MERRKLTDSEILRLAKKKVVLKGAQSQLAEAKANVARLHKEFEGLWDAAFPEDMHAEHTDEIVSIDDELYHVHLRCGADSQYFDVTPVKVIKDET